MSPSTRSVPRGTPRASCSDASLGSRFHAISVSSRLRSLAHTYLRGTRHVACGPHSHHRVGRCTAVLLREVVYRKLWRPLKDMPDHRRLPLPRPLPLAPRTRTEPPPLTPCFCGRP